MVKPEERTLIVNELAIYLGATGNVRQAIIAAFSVDSGEVLIRLPTDLNDVSAQAQWVIDYCLCDRWTKRPSLMESILQYLIQHGRNVLELGPILNQVQAGIDPNPDPYVAKWMLGDRPFVNRNGMRTLVKNFLQRNDRPVLLINGVEKAGKSYTLQFFDYLMDCEKSIMLTYDRLEKDTGPTYAPKFLADRLTISMDSSERIPEESGSMYAGQLSRWIVRTAMKQPTKCVMVVDGFGRLNPDGQADVHPQTLELIAALIQDISTGKQRQRLRLVLIDYYLPLDPALVLMENLQSNRGITVNDIIDCLAEYNARRQQQNRTMINPAELAGLAQRMMENATTGAGSMLPVLYQDLFNLTAL